MTGHRSTRNPRGRYYIRNAVVALLMVIALAAVFLTYTHQSSRQIGSPPTPNSTVGLRTINFSNIVEQVYPAQGSVLPVKWDGIARQLVDNGALNLSFVANSLSSSAQPLTNSELEALNGTGDINVTLNKSSALFTLYVLWALGINNKNPIINNGPVMNYGGNPYDLASTGGYGPLGKLQLGNLSIVTLNGSEQEMVEAIASNTYRPCCDNPAMFPDCNHGAAQLGLIELMASQGKNAAQIYNALKEFNAFYFPQQYLDVAVFFNYTQNKTWGEVPANEVLGYNFSSASGYQKVYEALANDNALPQASSGSGGSCSV